jgi:hypothetical protein
MSKFGLVSFTPMDRPECVLLALFSSCDHSLVVSDAVNHPTAIKVRGPDQDLAISAVWQRASSIRLAALYTSALLSQEDLHP